MVLVGGGEVSSRREKNEVIMNILEVVSGGAKKTQIIQRANLNYLTFKRIFPVLLEGGFIVEEEDPDGSVLYHLTDEGRALLKSGRAFYALLLERSPRPVRVCLSPTPPTSRRRP